MNIAYISYEDAVGCRFNGLDLCRYFRQHGDICDMFVCDRYSQEHYVWQVWPDGLHRRMRNILTAMETRMSLKNMFYPPALCFRKPLRRADVIHAHHISHSYLNFMEFPILSRLKPLVLTLHDFSIFTGHCPNPPDDCHKWKNGCRHCPDLNSVFSLRRDTASLLWKYKKAIWSNTSMNIVVASHWMLDKVNASPMFDHCEKHCIPFGLDLDIFIPGDKDAARRSLCIPVDNHVLMFRGLDAPAKGLPYLCEALHRLDQKKNLTLLTLNTNGHKLFDDLAKKHQLIDLGCVTSSQTMTAMYQAADVFVAPSLQETFGMMPVEAMACGVPVIVSEDTPQPEITCIPETGLVVPRRDPEALAAAMERMLDDSGMRLRMGRRGREIAIELYDFRQHARRLRELYNYVIDKRRKRPGKPRPVQ